MRRSLVLNQGVDALPAAEGQSWVGASPERGRPFTVATAVLTLAHSGFEAASGIGLPGQKLLRLPGATGGHLALAGVWLAAQRRPSRRARRVVAALNGMGLAGAVSHYIGWPVSWRGLPVLLDGAEGMRGAWVRAYNVLLYGWMATAAMAVIREADRDVRPWVALGLGTAPGIVLVSHRKLKWVRAEARRRPRWWNRACGGGI